MHTPSVRSVTPGVVLDNFLSVFSGSDTFGDSAVWSAMTCVEADAFAALLKVHGHAADAALLIAAHREDDPEACDEFGH